MAEQHYRATPKPAAARAAPTSLLQVLVAPRVEQPDCRQRLRVPAADCPARPSPEQLPALVTAPRHPAGKAAQSDPTRTHRLAGPASFPAVPVGTGGAGGIVPAFPRLAGTAAAARAFPHPAPCCGCDAGVPQAGCCEAGAGVPHPATGCWGCCAAASQPPGCGEAAGVPQAGWDGCCCAGIPHPAAPACCPADAGVPQAGCCGCCCAGIPHPAGPACWPPQPC